MTFKGQKMGIQDRDWYQREIDQRTGKAPAPKHSKPLPVFRFPSVDRHGDFAGSAKPAEPASPLKTAILTILAIALLAVLLKVAFT